MILLRNGGERRVNRRRSRRRRRRAIRNLRAKAEGREQRHNQPEAGQGHEAGLPRRSSEAAKAGHFFPAYSASVTGAPQVIVPP
jgi:hypothetical protein